MCLNWFLATVPSSNCVVSDSLYKYKSEYLWCLQKVLMVAENQKKLLKSFKSVYGITTIMGGLRFKWGFGYGGVMSYFSHNTGSDYLCLQNGLIVIKTFKSHLVSIYCVGWL